MKRILTFLTVALCTLAIAVSCGNKKSAAENGPVGQLLSLAEKAQSLEDSYRAGKITREELNAQSDAIDEQIEALLEANEDYQLTDADRDLIYQTAKSMAAAEGHQITEQEETMVKSMLKQVKTLEDLQDIGF